MDYLSEILVMSNHSSEAEKIINIVVRAQTQIYLYDISKKCLQTSFFNYIMQATSSSRTNISVLRLILPAYVCLLELFFASYCVIIHQQIIICSVVGARHYIFQFLKLWLQMEHKIRYLVKNKILQCHF